MDRSFSYPGRLINAVAITKNVGLVDTPEWVFRPAKIHAYGSYAVDLNDLAAWFIRAFVAGPAAGGGF